MGEGGRGGAGCPGRGAQVRRSAGGSPAAWQRQSAPVSPVAYGTAHGSCQTINHKMLSAFDNNVPIPLMSPWDSIE